MTKKKLDLFNFDSFKEEVILKLSEEEIKKVIKIKELKAGIEKIDEPIEPIKPAALNNLETTTLYSNYSLSYMYFRNKEELEKILTLTKNADKAGVSQNEELKIVTESDSYYEEKLSSITETKVLKKEAYKKVKHLITSYSKNLSVYKENKKVYDEYTKKRALIVTEVQDKINFVKEKYARIERYKKVFKTEYLDICDGNYNLALKFFKRATILAVEEENLILKAFEDFKKIADGTT